MKPIPLMAAQGFALGLLMALPALAQDVNAMAGQPAPADDVVAAVEASPTTPVAEEPAAEAESAEPVAETPATVPAVNPAEIRRQLEEAHDEACAEGVKAAKSALDIHEAVRECREKGRELYESFRTGSYLDQVPVETQPEAVETTAEAPAAETAAETVDAPVVEAEAVSGTAAE